MIEKTLLKYLKENLDVDVYAEEPLKKPSKYVLFERTAQTNQYTIKTTTFAIQSYAPSLLEAAELNEKVENAMLNMNKLDVINKVQLNSSYNFTDVETKRYRYQAVFHITHYI